jgi:hypothetical protein
MYDSLYQPTGGMYGDGWYDDAKASVKRAAKAVQSSSAVRDVEKGLVKRGSDVLRGAAEAATDGVADSALTALGAPEFAPLADKLIDRGAKALEKKGVDYLDQKIDQSGKDVRYMAATSGGGMRLAGQGTQIGRGLRLAGNGHGRMHGDGMRLAGSGMRLAGSGAVVQPHYLRGAGHACGCN